MWIIIIKHHLKLNFFIDFRYLKNGQRTVVNNYVFWLSVWVLRFFDCVYKFADKAAMSHDQNVWGARTRFVNYFFLKPIFSSFLYVIPTFAVWWFKTSNAKSRRISCGSQIFKGLAFKIAVSDLPDLRLKFNVFILIFELRLCNYFL